MNGSLENERRKLDTKDNKHRCDELRAPVAYVKGVGPSNAELLGRMGIFRAFELLFFFPRDYQEIRLKRGVEELVEGATQSVFGTIEDYRVAFSRIGQITTLFVAVGNERIKANWFKVQYPARTFHVGRRLVVTGSPKLKDGLWVFTHPTLTYIDDELFDIEGVDGSGLAELRVLPIYRLTEGLAQSRMRRVIGNALKELPDLLPEALPTELLEKRGLPTIAEAIRKIHQPQSLEEAEYARRRFVYQELLVLQLALAICRIRRYVNMKAVPLPRTAKIDSRIRSVFPFELTDSQIGAIREISEDMGRTTPMNRLLQGDVGSGKTVVAIYAALQAVANGAQAVLMAPTEVLARQHLRTLQFYLRNSSTKVVAVFGGQKPSERAQILEEIRSGVAQIVVGTQALVYNEIEFKKLGLAIVDEQHKFGVKQRALLKSNADLEPHYLVMTATPIPRSLTMTLFGDLDVSVMKNAPIGRRKTTTCVLTPQNRASWWNFVRERLDEGRQAYVVAPRVDGGVGNIESEMLEGRELTKLVNDGTLSSDFDLWNNWSGPDQERAKIYAERVKTDEWNALEEEKDSKETKLKTVWSVYNELSQGELKGYRLGIIHGRMTTAEKELVMLDFRSGAIQVLIATSVVEVGVDVPNATIMTIENAERFGLAQLHQLRGRVGRGQFPGFCAVAPTELDLVAEKKACLEKEGEKTEYGSKKKISRRKKKTEDEIEAINAEEKRREEGMRRLEFFASTTDGFELAEKDFVLRGPGQLFGSRQHGDAALRVADLSRDRSILEEANLDARELISRDPGLRGSELASLQRQVFSRYGREMELGDVG